MFGDPKKMVSDILAGPAGEPEGEEAEAAGLEEEQGDDMGLDAAAEELLAAVKSGDVAGVKSALKNAFAILESQPHDEYGDE